MGLFEGSTLSQTTQIFDDALSLGGFLDDNDDETRPFAYISYIVFNEGKESIASDRVRVSVDAGFDPSEAGLANQHEHLQFENDIVIAPEGKYIYLWVSNESEDTRVWFDDFTVTHQSTFVAHATDYGVWGDVLREQKSDVLEKYQYAYQGQFAEKDDETGWNHFELREFDPVVGRWTVTDPAGQYWSPYQGMSNNPVNSVDPDGGYSWAGALWRNLFYGGSGIYKSGEDGGKEVWGFNTAEGAHFGEDARSWLTTGGEDVLNRALDEVALNTFSMPDRIMYQYGGNGIEYDPLGQLMFTPSQGATVGFAGRVMSLGTGVTLRTDLLLLTRAAQKAEAAIGGTGRFAGYAKHRYATALLSRYQKIYGTRNFQFNLYFNNASKGGGYLDVVNHQTRMIYDFKFGTAVMRRAQFANYSRNFPGYTIRVVRP